MFTGIIEVLGKIQDIETTETNKIFTIQSDISHELKIDQSVAHNGVCLTVVECDDKLHKVVAINETLEKSSLDKLSVGDIVNLERCMIMNGRIDGHIVQGHVDTTGIVGKIINENGSWYVTIKYDPQFSELLVEKGSITVDGVSLTVVDNGIGNFSVAIIPYTWENTIFSQYQEGSIVNLEFDIIGKYIMRKHQLEEKVKFSE